MFSSWPPKKAFSSISPKRLFKAQGRVTQWKQFYLWNHFQAETGVAVARALDGRMPADLLQTLVADGEVFVPVEIRAKVLQRASSASRFMRFVLMEPTTHIILTTLIFL